MFHSQNIAKILQQGLKSVKLTESKTNEAPASSSSPTAANTTNNSITTSTTTTTTTVSPSSISLLSSSGQPLCSVFSDKNSIDFGSSATMTTTSRDDHYGQLSLDLTPQETLRVYSLIASTDFNNAAPWEILELNDGNYICLNTLKLGEEHNSSNNDGDSLMIIMMVCPENYPQKLAKLICDELNKVLQKGLKGFQ